MRFIIGAWIAAGIIALTVTVTLRIARKQIERRITFMMAGFVDNFIESPHTYDSVEIAIRSLLSFAMYTTWGRETIVIGCVQLAAARDYADLRLLSSLKGRPYFRAIIKAHEHRFLSLQREDGVRERLLAFANGNIDEHRLFSDERIERQRVLNTPHLTVIK